MVAVCVRDVVVVRDDDGVAVMEAVVVVGTTSSTARQRRPGWSVARSADTNTNTHSQLSNQRTAPAIRQHLSAGVGQSQRVRDLSADVKVKCG